MRRISNQQRVRLPLLHQTIGFGDNISYRLSQEENIDDAQNFASLMGAINTMAQTYSIPVIYSVHPRSARLIKQRQFQFHPLVRQLPPFGMVSALSSLCFPPDLVVNNRRIALNQPQYDG